MDGEKRAKLEAEGYWVGDAEDLLALDDHERKLVDLHLRLSFGVREARERAGLTQAALAKRIGSTRSRVARMEAGSPEVSLDLMLKAYFAAGGDLDNLPERGPANRPTSPIVRVDPRLRNAKAVTSRIKPS